MTKKTEEKILDPRIYEQSNSPFVKSIEIILNHRLSDTLKTALSYLTWEQPTVSFDEKIAALICIADSISQGNSVGCLFSKKQTLRGFLRAYSEYVSRIRDEIFNSEHGIDFWWTLVGNKDSRLPSKQPFPYGEWDLCLNAALEEAKSHKNDKQIVVLAQYWFDKSIQIELLFSPNGKLTGLRSKHGLGDPCARLLALMKVEEEESAVYWKHYRLAQTQAAERANGDTDKEKTIFRQLMGNIPHKRINPLIDIPHSSRMLKQNQFYFAKYQGIVDGFVTADLSKIDKELNTMRRILLEEGL